MTEPPTGTVTLVFTDIEGSAELLNVCGESLFKTVLDSHNCILRETADRWNGFVVMALGDAFFLAFARASDAVQFAVEVQLALAQHDWRDLIPSPRMLRVRIGMHTGEPLVSLHPDGTADYFGPEASRAARVGAAGHGGEILVSEVTRILCDDLPMDITFHDLGIHRLKGVGEEHLWQVAHPELQRDFPPLKTLEQAHPDIGIDVHSFHGSRNRNCYAGGELTLPPGWTTPMRYRSKDATPRGQFESKENVQRDAVDCTVYAPPEVKAGTGLMVQVWIHLPGQYDEVRTAALEADTEASRRGGTSLATEIAPGSKLTFELLMPGVEIDEPVQEMVWQGRTTSVQFGVEVSMSAAARALIGKVLVSQESVPIGQIRFKLAITETLRDKPSEPTGEAQRYQMAFISYASQDRVEVLRRVQMLSAVGIRFFQDFVTLEPGQNWEREIYRHIDESDIMFLFWSTAAKQSEWVEKEWRYGLQRGVDGFIRPVIVEGPPIVPPPLELAHLHFNDRVLYFISAEESSRQSYRKEGTGPEQHSYPPGREE